jgi:hypothetical protein
MGDKRALTSHHKEPAVLSAIIGLFAGAMMLMLMSAVAAAQEAAPGPKSPENPGFFGSIGRWFDEQAATFNSKFKDAGKNVENFGHEAGIAAKTTVDTAKDAAGAVARIPGARVMTGHEKCAVAPNGAPDCVAAAVSICKAKGFDSGKSMDMTTAEVCPPKVMLSGRNTGPECRDETFVSRALCQ